MKKLLILLVGLSCAWAPVLLNAQETETFAEWLDRHSVPAHQRGMADDPAGDSIGNLVKYALGLNPLAPARDALPQPEFFEGGHLGFSVSKNPQAVGVEIIVEASSNLSDWSDAEVEVTETEESLTAVDTVSSDASERRYLRLRVPGLPPVDLPDAYLYVVGGRTLGTQEENVDEELDAIHFSINSRGILVADVDLENHSVTNWRRAGFLPTDHPERVDGNGDPMQLHWLYIHDSVHIHNGRIYASTSGTGGGESVPADFVAWADIDIATGEVGEFSTSARVPGPEVNQRISATAIVEVDGVHYYYVLGGGSDPGQTARILYAAIDDATGAIGEWQISSTSLPTTDWFNAAIGDSGMLIHSSGNGRTSGVQTAIDIVAPDSGGNITSSWTSASYDWWYDTARRWDHVMLKARVGDDTFAYLVGGVDDGLTSASTYYSRLIGGVPEQTGDWLQADFLPEPRRRVAGAAVGNMLVIAGGAPTSLWQDARDTVYIGVVGSDGAVTWSQAEEPMLHARSFHGAAIAPVGQ